MCFEISQQQRRLSAKSLRAAKNIKRVSDVRNRTAWQNRSDASLKGSLSDLYTSKLSGLITKTKFNNLFLGFLPCTNTLKFLISLFSSKDHIDFSGIEDLDDHWDFFNDISKLADIIVLLLRLFKNKIIRFVMPTYINFSKDDFMKIINLLHGSPIKHLDVSNQYFNEEKANAVAELIGGIETLVKFTAKNARLDTEYNPLTFKIICDALRLTNVKEVDFSDNENLQYLNQIDLKNGWNNLSVLVLSGCAIGRLDDMRDYGLPENLCYSLIDFIQSLKHSNLETLDLRGNPLGEGGTSMKLALQELNDEISSCNLDINIMVDLSYFSEYEVNQDTGETRGFTCETIYVHPDLV
jgi:hypothetical protein